MKKVKKKLKKEKKRIIKNMTILDVISKYPKTTSVFEKHGLHCVGCPMAMQETIAEVAMHSVDLKKLLKELNEAAKK